MQIPETGDSLENKQTEETKLFSQSIVTFAAKRRSPKEWEAGGVLAKLCKKYFYYQNRKCHCIDKS